MLKGNRKLASVIAGLIAVAATAALAPIVGMPDQVALVALGIEGTLASGGVVLSGGE